MRARVDESLWKAAHGEGISEERLQNWLYDWGLYDEENVEAWIIWRRSGYVSLPFDGGWFDQPKTLRKDFLTLDLVKEYFDKQVHKPSLDGVIDPLAEFDE